MRVRFPSVAAASTHPLSGLRISDVLTFVSVRRLGSMGAVSRELRVSPSQVSKAISRLEKLFGLPLLERGRRGVKLAGGASAVADELERMLDSIGNLRAPDSRATQPLNVAGQSFLLQLFLPRIA